MPYDIPRLSGYRIQPFKLQDDEALVATMAQQLLKARLAEARAAAGGGRGGGGGGGRGRSGGKEKGAWVRKFDPKTGRYERVWVEGSTGEERKGTVHGEDFNKTSDWLDSSPEAQRLLGVLRNGNASNKARQKALSEFRSLKGDSELEGLSPAAVDEAIERKAKPYKTEIEAEKKEIAGSGSGLLTNIRIGAERLGTFISTIGDDAETTLEKRRKSLEKQREIRESDPYTREQMRREAEGENLWDRSDGAAGVAANAAGFLLSDPSALPVAGGALVGGLVGGIPGAIAGASIAGAGGAAAGDTYLGERLVQDDRLSEAERVRAYEEGKASEMGLNAVVNAIPFGGGTAVRAGRTALAAAGRTALGREAAGLATDFARSSAWRTAEAAAPYAERFGGLAGDAAEQAVAKAAMRPIAADLVRQSERGVAGALKYDILPEAAVASGLNAAAMAGSNAHYNALTGQDDSVMQNVPEAAAMGLLFGIPYGVGSALGARRRAAAGVAPERRLALDQRELDKLAQKEAATSYNEAYGISEEKPAEEKSAKGKAASKGEGGEAPAADVSRAPEDDMMQAAANLSPAPVRERGPADMPKTPQEFAKWFAKDASPEDIEATLRDRGLTPEGTRKWLRDTFPDALQTDKSIRDLYDRIPVRAMQRAEPTATSQGSAWDSAYDLSERRTSGFSAEGIAPQAERRPTSGNAVAFSDAEQARLSRLNSEAWPEAVKRGWADDPGYKAALSDYMAAVRDFNKLNSATVRKPETLRKAQARIDAAASRFDNVVAQLMLRDADLLDPRHAANAAGRGIAPEVKNGEGGLPEGGPGAAVPGSRQSGEAGAGQADTGAGRPLGAYTQSPAGTNARGVSEETGGGNTPHQRSGLSGGTGRGAPETQDLARGLTDAWGRPVSRSEGTVGERGAGDAAEVRPDAGTLAGGTGHPAEPSAGSNPAGSRDAAALTPSGRGAEFELRNELGKIGSGKMTSDGIRKGAEKLAKLGLDRDAVARFMDVFPWHRDPFFTKANERDMMFDPALRRQLGLTPASNKNFTESMKRGIMRLADYYGIPPVTANTVRSFNPGYYGHQLISALNGRFAELRSAGVPLTDSVFSDIDVLRGNPINSAEWDVAAASLLNGAMKDALDGVNLRGGAMGAQFFMENFPERWRPLENGSKKPNPITVADVADRLDQRETLGETAGHQRNGDQIC